MNTALRKKKVNWRASQSRGRGNVQYLRKYCDKLRGTEQLRVQSADEPSWCYFERNIDALFQFSSWTLA